MRWDRRPAAVERGKEDDRISLAPGEPAEELDVAGQGRVADARGVARTGRSTARKSARAWGVSAGERRGAVGSMSRWNDQQSVASWPRSVRRQSRRARGGRRRTAGCAGATGAPATARSPNRARAILQASPVVGRQVGAPIPEVPGQQDHHAVSSASRSAASAETTRIARPCPLTPRPHGDARRGWSGLRHPSKGRGAPRSSGRHGGRESCAHGPLQAHHDARQDRQGCEGGQGAAPAPRGEPGRRSLPSWGRGPSPGLRPPSPGGKEGKGTGIKIGRIELDARQAGQGDEVEPVVVAEGPGCHRGPLPGPVGERGPDLPRERVDRPGLLERDSPAACQGAAIGRARGSSAEGSGVPGTSTAQSPGGGRVSAVQSPRRHPEKPNGTGPPCGSRAARGRGRGTPWPRDGPGRRAPGG